MVQLEEEAAPEGPSCNPDHSVIHSVVDSDLWQPLKSLIAQLHFCTLT